MGQYNMFNHVTMKIRQLFLRPAACLTSTLLETEVGINHYKCSHDRLEIILVTHPTGLCKRCLASAPSGHRAHPKKKKMVNMKNKSFNLTKLLAIMSSQEQS
jgi:hypothetical protein